MGSDPLLALKFRRVVSDPHVTRRLTAPFALLFTPLLVVPVVVAVSIPFSLIGDGAAVRAASITWFLWLGLLAWRLLRIADSETTDRNAVRVRP